MAIRTTFRTDKDGIYDYQIRESWRGDEMQRYYLSTVNIDKPDESISDAIVWQKLPGTNGRYHFAIKRTTNTDANGKTTIWASFCMQQKLGDEVTTRFPVRVYTALNTKELPGAGGLWPFGEKDNTYYRLISEWQLFSSLSENQLVPGSATITVHIQEPHNILRTFWDFPSKKFPFEITHEMGSGLLSPDNGDVVFETFSPTGEIRKLYAWKFVLSARCLYYKTMFMSSFAEGKSQNSDIPSGSEDDFLRRKRIKVEDDFNLFHNILYYLHTDHIIFGTDLTYEPPEKYLPRLSAVEDIYAMADRLFLVDLKKKAFNFLKTTCTVENITARTFSKFSMLYEEIGEMYATYFRGNWKLLKATKEYEEFFTEKLSEADFDDFTKLFKRYRVVMENDNWRL